MIHKNFFQIVVSDTGMSCKMRHLYCSVYWDMDKVDADYSWYFNIFSGHL